MNGNGATDLVRTTSSTSFTRPATLKKRKFSSLYYILCLSMGITSKCHFSPWLPSGSPKTGTLVVPKLWMLISFSNQVYFDRVKQYLIALENIFPMVYRTLQLDLILPLISRDLWSRVKFPIWLPPLLLFITYANQV